MMKKKSISLIVGLMSLALLGVMAMQLYFLRESYKLKTQLFNQAVNESLSNIVAKIEKQDAFNFLDNKEKEHREISKKPLTQFVRIKSRPLQLKHNDGIEQAIENTPENVSQPAGALVAEPRFAMRQNDNRLNSRTFLSRLKKGFPDTVAIAQLPDKPAQMRLSGAYSKTYNYSNRRPEFSREINSERYSRLLEAEQYKADLVFRQQDSILRKKFPVAFEYKDVMPDLEETPEVDVKMDVVEYKDAFGRLQQYAKLHVVPSTATTSIIHGESPKRSTRRDTIVRYVVMDPIVGAKLVSIPKPRMVQVSPQILEEDRAKQLREASRVNRFVKKIDTKNALQDLVTEFQKVDMPLTERIKFSMLDSLLRSEFKNNGIDIPFEYKVLSSKKDSVIFSKASNKQPFIAENTYQTNLFPKDIVSAGMLSITFPGKNSVIFSNMSVMMGSSAGLLLILLFCFGYTIHIILRQKKISEMKTDFINNMTHEFKTPVATIMIASEALKDPEVTEDQSRIKRLAGIIYDENVRLGMHIERVLNIAKIDKDDLKLEHKPVDMNDLVTAIADSMALQLQKKDATINLDLQASSAIVYGDELHLSNVIFNLIDNAIKYSPEKPQVTISTCNQGKNLSVCVSDKGIGMNRDQLTKIFEQFYRIPTGNLHDVKGFGLGLSYVSNIVKRLHGTVKVKSERDKGSEFEVILPAHNA